jgi:hypothetical protein
VEGLHIVQLLTKLLRCQHVDGYHVAAVTHNGLNRVYVDIERPGNQGVEFITLVVDEEAGRVVF